MTGFLITMFSILVHVNVVQKNDLIGILISRIVLSEMLDIKSFSVFCDL